MASVHTGNASEQLVPQVPQQNINSCLHCTGATFETEQKPIRYSVNIALRPVFTDQSMFDQSIKLIRTSSKYFDTLIKVL